MRFSALSLAFVAAVLASPAASAVETGKVERLRTEPGSVLVVREGKPYELKEGDAVFEGDQIFTRTYGAASFSIGGCAFGLGGRQAIVVKLPQVCTLAPTTLQPDDVIAGIRIGVGAGVPAGIGATPLLLGTLALGGGAAAAAAAGGNNDNPSSP